MRKVKYVRLQANDAFIPGIGALADKGVMPNTVKSFKRFEMETDGVNLHVIVESVDGRHSIEALIPLTNCQIIQLVPEEKAKGDKK